MLSPLASRVLSRRRRRALALALAVGGHVALYVGFVRAPQVAPREVAPAPQIAWQAPPRDRTPIDLVVAYVSPPEAPSPAPPTPAAPTTTTTTTAPAATATPATEAPAPATPATATATTAPASTTTTATASTTDAPALPPLRTPAVGEGMADAIRGLDARGPQPSMAALSAALDFQPDGEKDKGLSGGALAAARGTRNLKRDQGFDDVSAGLGDDWFREVKRGALAQFRPEPRDLDHPADVSAPAIWQHFVLDPASWDDVAKEQLTDHYRAEMLSSADPIQRLPLGNSAALGEATNSAARRAVVDDLFRRKKAGLSVRFAFEVDVHHDAAGHVTAVDVLRPEFEQALRERVRAAVVAGIREAGDVAARVADGRPFRSRWVFAATWFIDPPMLSFAQSSSLFAQGPAAANGSAGVPPLLFRGKFDVGEDGALKTSSYDVQLKTSAELLYVEPLGPR